MAQRKKQLGNQKRQLRSRARFKKIFRLFQAITLITTFSLQLQAQSFSYQHVIDIDSIEYPGIQTTALQRLGMQQKKPVKNGKVTFMNTNIISEGIEKCVYVQHYKSEKLDACEIKTKGKNGYKELLQLFEKITGNSVKPEIRSLERNLYRSGIALTANFTTDKRHKNNSLLFRLAPTLQ